jgi:hypothetical protein
MQKKLSKNIKKVEEKLSAETGNRENIKYFSIQKNHSYFYPVLLALEHKTMKTFPSY